MFACCKSGEEGKNIIFDVVFFLVIGMFGYKHIVPLSVVMINIWPFPSFFSIPFNSTKRKSILSLFVFVCLEVTIKSELIKIPNVQLTFEWVYL